MNAWWVPPLFFGLFILAGIASVVSMYFRALRHAAGWRRLAAERGLTCEIPEGILGVAPVFWRIHGAIDGVPVSVHQEKVRPGRKKGRIVTRVTVELANVPPDLEVSVETFGDKLKKVFGAGDVEVGDPDLDGALKLRAPGAAEARSFLNQPSMRVALLELARHHATFRLAGTTAAIQGDRLVTDPDEVARRVDRLVALGRAAQKASS